MRASAASVTASALRSPFATARAISEALAQSIAAAQALNTGAGSASSGSAKAATSAPWRSVTCEMAAHRRHPGLVDREIERAGARRR